MYRVGKIAENRGIPKVVIITAQVGTIVVSNFVSVDDEKFGSGYYGITIITISNWISAGTLLYI